MPDFTNEKWSVEAFFDFGADIINANDEVIASVYDCEHSRLIAAAPEMFNLLKLYAEGNCRDCKKRKELARKLLDRIEGKEDNS